MYNIINVFDEFHSIASIIVKINPKLNIYFRKATSLLCKTTCLSVNNNLCTTIITMQNNYDVTINNPTVIIFWDYKKNHH